MPLLSSIEGVTGPENIAANITVIFLTMERVMYLMFVMLLR